MDWIKSLLKVISNINNPLKINFYKFNNWNESFNSGWFSTAKLLIRFSRSGLSPFLQTLSQMLRKPGAKTGSSRMLHSELDTTLYTAEVSTLQGVKQNIGERFCNFEWKLVEKFYAIEMKHGHGTTTKDKRGAGETKYVFYLLRL